MMKVTVLYGHPTSPSDFESYYAETHTPIAAKMSGVARLETTKLLAGPDGGKPAYYRLAEVYFETEAQMQATLASAEGQATVADLSNFATGGVTMMIGAVEG
jgi:uncharacterized protein (TIGR02118 family)